MQKIYKVIISLILAALLINVIPFKLFAESTFIYINESTVLYKQLPDSYNNIYQFTAVKTNGDIRVTAVKNGNFTYYIAVSLNPGASLTVTRDNLKSGGTSTVNSYNLTSTGTYNNSSYYYSGFSQTITSNIDFNNVPVHDRLQGETVNQNTAFYYTYGEGAEEPEPVTNYGLLKIGFKTDIAYSGGNQDAWRLNKDTIYFDRYDTLGNDLFGYLIELQAVPFSVYDSSKQNVISKTVNDYLYDTVHVGSLGYWSPGQDYIDFTWEYITTRFSPVWWSTYGDNWSFTGWALENQWYRVGWSYRARLVDDEYNELIPWQWIYNGTSIDGPDVNNIVNNNGLTPELVNSINNINNYNNTTNNNTYNNQTINYYDSDQQSDGSWIEALLESILGTIADLVGKILDFFKSILDGLLDLILGLFGDVDPAGSFFNWFSDLFNGIGDIDLTLPQFNLPNEDLSSFSRLVQETLNIFSSNNIAFLIFIPLIILILRAVF